MSSRWTRLAALCALGGAITCVGAWSWAQQAAKPKPDVAMNAPDPPALRIADQYVLHFRYDNGKVSWLASRPVHLPQPRTTPRVTGRWALELLSGPTLVDRVRFDFPGLGADELAGQTGPRQSPPRFERKAVVDHYLMVPDSPRFSRARLVDRATGRVMTLPWPPVPPSDAGADAPPDARGADDGGRADSSVPDAPAPVLDATPMKD